MKNNYQYISLQEATRYCRYSQEYLSLRARQGKLKAKKIGRNWITTKEWVGEYDANFNQGNNLKQISDRNCLKKARVIKEAMEPKEAKGIRETKKDELILKQPSIVFEASYCAVRKESPPPKNLPTGNFVFSPAMLEKKITKKSFGVSFGLISSFCFSLIVFGFVFANPLSVQFLEINKNKVRSLLENNKDIVVDSFFGAGNDLAAGFKRERNWIFSAPKEIRNFVKQLDGEAILAGIGGLERLNNFFNKKLEKSVLAVGEFFVNGQDALNKNFDKINFGVYQIATKINQGAISLLSQSAGGAKEARESLGILLKSFYTNFSRIDFSFVSPVFAKILETAQIVGESGDKIIKEIVYRPAEKILAALDGLKLGVESISSVAEKMPGRTIEMSDKIFAIIAGANANAEVAFDKTIISTKKWFTKTRIKMGVAVQRAGFWLKNNFQTISELLIKPTESLPVDSRDSTYNREMIDSLKKEVEALKERNIIHEKEGN